MMKFSTAVVRRLTVGVLMAVAGCAAAQQAYPNKPIRIITPYPPGGSTTIASRLIGQKLTENWGQQVLVDSRPGGNTIIGSEALAKSAPDGYTIMLTTSTFATNPSLITLPYDPIKDFAPVATISKNEYVLVLSPSVPANSLREFIALAKSRPGQLNYGAVGTGGPQQLAAESLSMLAGVKLQHIPYKGAGQLLPDLMGGQVQLAFMNPLNAIPHVKNGQLKAIAISGETLSSALPDVPTFTKAGLPGFEARNWLWIFAPAGTPKEIVGKLSTEIGKILAMPDIKEKLISQGVEPVISTPDQMAALLKGEIARLGKIIKAANIRLGK